MNEARQPIAYRFRGYLPVAIDLETGGFNARTDALLEIAATIIEMNDEGLLVPGERHFFNVEPFEGANIEQSSLEFTGIDPTNPLRLAVDEKKALSSVFRAVRKHIRETGCQRAMHNLAKMEGLSVEPASAVAFAGLVKLMRAGVIKPNEVVVVNCTGHTMPIERNILGEGWSKDIVIPNQGIEDGNEEGLLAALSKVAIDRFPRIAIADDNPEVRRLIRRILQSQGNYQLYEANNGREAIDLVRQERPNLLILDLMMPEVDGFTVMEELKKSPETAEIPVIVVTAKELTPAEKERMRGHIQSLMQKGDFMSDELLDEVRALLG